MKKIVVFAASFIILFCVNNQISKRRQERRTSHVATSVTNIISGNESASVLMKVSRVIDGDTFEGHIVMGGDSRTAAPPQGGGWWAQQMAVTVLRINGIDAPERGQYYGDVAATHLDWLIRGKTVELKMKQRDQYGRWIATVYAEGKDIGAEMLKEGMAWHYGQYDNSVVYAQLEAEAKREGCGLWGDERAVAPWVWRKMSKYERDAYR